MAKPTTTITATPCGKDRHGNPLKPRQLVVDDRREDWGDGRTRVFVRRPDLDAHPGQQCFAPEVVRTDSIVESDETIDARALVAMYDERIALTKAMAEHPQPTGAMAQEILAKSAELDAACEKFRRRWYPRKHEVIVAGRTVMVCSPTRRNVTTVHDATLAVTA